MKGLSLSGWFEVKPLDCTCQGRKEVRDCPARGADREVLKGAPRWFFSDYEPLCEYVKTWKAEHQLEFWTRRARLEVAGLPYKDKVPVPPEIPVEPQELLEKPLLFLLGPTGTGKTWALVGMALWRAAQWGARTGGTLYDYRALYVHVPSINPWDDEGREGAAKADVLILDDLTLSDTRLAPWLLAVVDARYREERPLLVAGNISKRELEGARTTMPWAPIVSRLMDKRVSVVVWLGGGDRRR